MASLDKLPKELYHNITSNFNTANDLATFGSVCRETQAFTKHNGWQNFVKQQFPGFDVPIHDTLPWDRVADQLTYADRCWSKRAFYTTVWAESWAGRKESSMSRNQIYQNHIGYTLVVSASLLSSSLDELLVAGAGNDVVSRQSADLSREPGPWRKLPGQSEGHSAGDGDVTSLSIVDRYKSPEVVIGRANGEVSLRTLDANGFRRKPRKLLPWLDGQDMSKLTPPTRSFAWKVITSSDWHSQSQMLSTTQGSYLRLYSLSGEETDHSNLEPIALYDVSQEAETLTPQVRTSKFINADTVVFGMSNADQPLRWGRIRPEGFELLPGTNFPSAPRVSSDATDKPVTTVRAVEPVKAFGPNVVLSAWEDGSIRLGDIRTPSYTDAVYRDRFHAHQISSSLLTYGGTRFVAGDNSYPNLRIFDFRMNDTCYQHTDGLKCSAKSPDPKYKFGFVNGQQNDDPATAAHCNHMTGTECNWHHESQQRRWKPDATIYISNRGRVGSLAKASDVSGAFYAGIDRSLLEMTPKLTEDNQDHTHERKAPKQWTGWRGSELAITETGIGLCGTKEWRHSELGVPQLMRMDTKVASMLADKQSAHTVDKRFRLDVAYKPPGLKDEEAEEWTSRWYTSTPTKDGKSKDNTTKKPNKKKQHQHRRNGSNAQSNTGQTRQRSGTGTRRAP